MDCPKCSATCQDDALECARCGVVFAKFAERPHAPAVPAIGPPVADRRDEGAPATSGAAQVARAAALVALVAWTWQFARAPMGTMEAESVLHLPNLVFHEAGHVILGVFGRFIGVLGGSLFQFAVPLVLAGALLRQRDQFGAAVCTWWAGQNLVDLAPYIADARALQLVLLGGKTGAEVEGHDWEYLLGALGWMRHDRMLGLLSRRVGLAIMIASIAWGVVVLARGPQHLRQMNTE